MKKMEKFFKEEEGKVIHTRAECIIYTVKIDIGDPTLKLYPGFKVGNDFLLNLSNSCINYLHIGETPKNGQNCTEGTKN